MSSVTNTLIDGTGRGLQDVTVRISLIAPLNPFLLNGTGEVISKVAVDTDHDGAWTATLTPNDQFEATDTYYLVDETEAPSGQLWAIRMPDDSNTYTLRQVLITPPSGEGLPPFEFELDDLTDVNTTGELPGDVLTFNSNRQWVPALPQVVPLEFSQNSPATPWVWQHNTGRRLVCDVYDGQGNRVVVSLQQPDVNTVVVNWGAPATGTIEAR